MSAKRSLCTTCGHRVYVTKGRLCEHDVTGHTFPRKVPQAPTGKLAERIGERRRHRIMRAVRSWASRLKCSGSGGEVTQ